MPKSNFFLRTKLLPPRAIVELIARPRLTEKLKRNLDSPITMVAADAGYGKTTLIADFVRTQNRPTVWYQLDHTDADPFVFLGYVAQGIKNFESEFGSTIFPYLAEPTDDLLLHPDRAVDLLLNEILETVDRQFILVLDDYHHIGRETVVHKLVDRLLQYASDLMHLIITTRDLPPLAFARRKTQSRALIITREDLLFTDEEVRELFRSTLNVELIDEELAEYRDRTQGWITALQLVRQVAEQQLFTNREPQIDLREVLHQSEKDIFDYFAEEVFSRETDEIRNLLLNLSLLKSLPLEDCSQIFPDERCAAVLPELLHKNVFLTVAGDASNSEEYRLHPLFRNFLQRRFRSIVGKSEINAKKIRIGEYFASKKRWELALSYFLEAEDFDDAARLVAEHGSDWFSGGAVTMLENFASQIPSEILDKFPRALLHKAEIARLQGDLSKSSNILNRAVDLLHRSKDLSGEAEALHSLASLARKRGKPAEAFELLEMAEKLVDEDTETFIKCANTRGLCLIEQSAWTNAEQQFRFALELAEKNSNEKYVRIITHNLALPPGFRGDFGESLRWLKRIFRDEHSGNQLPQEAIGHLNVARLHLYRGEFEESEKHLERSLELCQLYNLKSLGGEIFEMYGNFYRDTGDMAHASEFYERAANAYEIAGVDIANRDLDEERAKFYLIQGDVAKSRGLLEKVIAARTKSKNEVGLQRAKLHLLEARLIANEAEDLVSEAVDVLNFFHIQTLYHDEAMASILLALIFFRNNDRVGMMPHLQRALDLAARFDYEHWLFGEIQKNPELFKDEDIIEKLPLDLREKVRVAKRPVVSNQVVIYKSIESVTDLSIKLLGHVEIYRDTSRPFASDAWTTRRARDIFCHIAISPYRRVSKDILIDLFWKDEELSAIEKNFHPTISHIRKALNNNQTIKQNFVVFRDGAYHLNPDLSYSIDTELFEELISGAEQAKKDGNRERFVSNLENARELYRGEFMNGIYEDWAETPRNYYEEQYLRVLTALSKLSFKEKNWSSASKYINEVLAKDPFREGMHRLLMKVLAAQGKRAAVKEQYDTLEKLLRDDLGVAPAAETKRVLDELLNQ